MLAPHTITARELVRNYKQVFDNIKKTKRPSVVSARREPQVAIVSLEDLEKLNQLKAQQSARGLLRLAELGKKIKGEGPKDLSANLDKYTWDD